MKFRRFSTLFFALLLILTIGCQTATPQTDIAPYSGDVTTYVSTEFEFSVDYPKEWKVLEKEIWPEGSATMLFYAEGSGAQVLVVVCTPMGDPTFDFRSLEDLYARWVIAGADREGSELLSEHDVVVDGLPAKELTFTHTMGSVWKHSAVAFLDTRRISPPASNAIKIIYDVPMDIYDDYYQYFRLMVDTFEFIDYT